MPGSFGIHSPLSFSYCFICVPYCSALLLVMCTSNGGDLPIWNTVPTIFTTSMKSCYSQAVLPRFFFPQCEDFPQRIHLPNMSTSGNSVEIIAYDSQLQPQYQWVDEGTKRETLRVEKTLPRWRMYPVHPALSREIKCMICSFVRWALQKREITN